MDSLHYGIQPPGFLFSKWKKVCRDSNPRLLRRRPTPSQLGYNKYMYTNLQYGYYTVKESKMLDAAIRSLVTCSIRLRLSTIFSVYIREIKRKINLVYLIF